MACYDKSTGPSRCQEFVVLNTVHVLALVGGFSVVPVHIILYYNIQHEHCNDTVDRTSTTCWYRKKSLSISNAF